MNRSLSAALREIRAANWGTPLLVMIITLLVTWAARVWVRARLPLGEPVSVIGNVFRLTHGENSGVAFSILRGSVLVPWLSAAALVAVAVYLWRPLQHRRLGQIALGLILGGGLANLLDRLDDGRVTDYLDWGIGTWRFATFNLPDTAIVIGFALVGRLLWRAAPDPAAHAADGATGGTARAASGTRDRRDQTP